jgi:hypothetical protein
MQLKKRAKKESSKGFLCRGFSRQKNQERRKKMRKGILLVLVLGLMVFCATKDSSAQGGPPVLEKIWASPETAHGKLLKIYIKASDPDGDMKYLIVSAGRGKQTTASIPIRLKKEMGKSLNGYVYWDTSRAKKNTSGTVEIMIEDSKGNESEAKSLSVSIKAKDAKVEKAPADFQEFDIAPVILESIQIPTP